jgi:hypothetical protein
VANRNILLIEPGYKNKYPPLGLMKIAQYHGPNGKNDNVTFVKGEDKSVLSKAWDRIYVTTLFSFEWTKTSLAINFAIQAAGNQTSKIFVGGIAASLMHEEFLAQPQWRGIRFIQGLLDKSPAESLQLDDFSEELYSDDTDGDSIEDLIPDYSILKQIEYEYPVNDAYFSYTSRGCIRKCKFCGVPKLEGGQRDVNTLTAVVEGVTSRFGIKKDLILMDNNVVASPKYKEIIAEIRDLGFERGATIMRKGRSIKRRVDFNQGVDARILCKDPMYLQEMSTICISPLRIAFDHWGMQKVYEKAIRYSADAGLKNLSNYMLYNFKDSPADLYKRMRLNIELNEDLNIRIFSFPMRYQPVDLKDRSHIGDKWNRYYLRSIQLVLQATHGVVSGAPIFFKHAFGETEEEFFDILSRPQHFIFNREWYEQQGGKSEFEQFTIEWNKLTANDRNELFCSLSGAGPSQFANLQFKSKKLQNILRFYVPLKPEQARFIWDARKKQKSLYQNVSAEIPNDERVEDAGLEIAV